MMSLPVIASFSSGTGSRAHDPMACVWVHRLLLQLFIKSFVLVFHSCLIYNKEDIVNRGPGEAGPRDHEADDRQRFFRILVGFKTYHEISQI